MLGKTHTEETKEKIRENSLKNNPMYKGFWKEHENGHPKGMLGKEHSIETKKQISQTLINKGVNRKGVCVEFPSGEKIMFDSIGDCASFLNVCETGSAFRKMLDTGEPYVIGAKNQHTHKLEHLVGIRLHKITPR